MAATCDQIAAAAHRPGHAAALARDRHRTQGGGGACDRDYGCSYSGTISFRTASTPLPMEYNPRKLFQRLFGRGDTPEERKALVQQYGSMLDMVSARRGGPRAARSAPRDQAMLSDYLESVREIERRVQKTEAQDLSKLKLPDVPVGIPDPSIST